MTSSTDITLAEATRLEAHVQSRLCGRVRDLRLSVHDKGIVLQGRTHTYYAKQLAQHAVMEATELPVLANDIEVYSASRCDRPQQGPVELSSRAHRVDTEPKRGEPQDHQ